MQSKTLLAQHQKQIFNDKARKKSRPTLKSSKSEAVLSNRPDSRAPTLSYVTNPPVNTQTKLFTKRKQDFLTDMKKCEEIYANHKNAEQRLNNRET
jgi:hypothetical protein